MAAASPIYLDYQATTPLAPEARAAMLPWLAGPETTGFANPHSAHAAGRAAAAAVEVAREQVEVANQHFTEGNVEQGHAAVRDAVGYAAKARDFSLSCPQLFYQASVA